jgi:hypothetical protein
LVFIALVLGIGFLLWKRRRQSNTVPSTPQWQEEPKPQAWNQGDWQHSSKASTYAPVSEVAATEHTVELDASNGQYPGSLSYR